MARLSTYRVLVAGMLSPPASAFLGLTAYSTLTRASANREQDFIFRLSMVSLFMLAPFIVTAILAWRDRQRGGGLNRSARAGLAIAALSLAMTYLPLNGMIQRRQQSRNLAMAGEAAPLFDTPDILGEVHRLKDHSGKVVLVNVWATWCPPCKKEMPELDRLYRERKDEGLMVFGLSTEEAALQQAFARDHVAVSYPLLTVNGDVPSLYRDIQRYPALILIDRNGRLRPAPPPNRPFEEVEAAVNALLKGTEVPPTSR